ncbi:hypothetical protein N7532_009971 [Penicillium argentinense]|uniref:Uncharacterized protein n=1 Tax=Penicillium argentinense TaxID=1131581 RepID=A0A9W9JXK9_9EURO|nr:uncharacterized protein N7532_009971 [Penicillium argentinense]KAJ5085200.1 hypothetical protein N7532_009971 [Penicillium argentinense]
MFLPASRELFEPGAELRFRHSQCFDSKPEQETDTNGTCRASVPFLLNYSSTSNRHPGEVDAVLSAFATTKSSDHIQDPTVPSILLEDKRADLFYEDLWNLFLSSYQNHQPSDALPLPGGVNDRGNRQSAAKKVIDCLLRAQATPIYQELNVDRAKDFFSDHNIYNFIVAYFDHTVRPRSRIVLKSSFNLPSTGTPLLLSILLMGAMYGTSTAAKSHALEYTDIAEAIVFDDPGFSRLVYQKKVAE